MGSLANYTEKKILDHIFGVASYNPPTEAYLALSTTAPNESGGNVTEPSGGGYSRVRINFNGAGARKLVQAGDIVFPEATADWGNVTDYAIYDNATGGNMLAYGTFNLTKHISTGATATIPGSSIVLEIASGGSSTAYITKILDWLFNLGTLPQPSNIYVALLTVEVIDSDTASDLTDFTMTGYHRQAFNDWTAAAGSPAVTKNGSDINFGTLTGTGVTLTAVALVDVASGNGDIIAYDNSLNSAIASGNTVVFKSNDFVCQLS